MYRSKATILTSKSLTTLSKVCRQQPQSLKIFTFSKNLSTASQISEFDNYNSLKDENYTNFQQNPDEGFNYDSKNRDSLNKDWIFNGNSKKIEQNPSGVYRQNPRSEFQEPTSKGFQQNLFAQNDNLTSRRVDFSSRNEFQQKPHAQNENFSSGRVDFSPRNEFQQKPYTQNENFSSGLVDFSPSNEFQQKPYTQNENFSSGRVDFSPRNEFQQNQQGQNENFSSGRVNVVSRNEFQQTVWGNGSSDFVSRNDYRSNLVEHNRSDSGYHGESSSKSRFEGGVQAQLGQNGVNGNYYQNLNGYNGGNIGVPQQSFPNYNRGNVRNVQSGNSGTYPQSASGYNMERNVGSSGYSTEMIGKYQQNVGGFNASSTGNQVSYQYQNVMVGHEEMRSWKPVEQSSESADSSNIKGSIEELDNFCKEVKLKEAVEVLHLLEQQHVTVDLSRYIMLMDVCGEDKSLEEAKSVHEHLVRSHPHLDVKMYNKILEMYGKCGSMKDAFLVFQKMPQRNLTSWDAMITWLGKNGLGEDAIELFAEFKKTEMKPDGQMFLGVFHACSVVGDIVEGMLHFDSMNKDYGIVYSMEHYVGVVDMLGSTGYLDEAMDFIEKMPIEPTVEVWETMMNLCRIHGNLELGDRCAEIVEFLDPSRLDEQSKAGFLPVKVSDIAKEKEKKKFAQSLLEARSRVHEYRAGDRSHPDHEKIYELLRGLKQLMKEDGYIPEVKFVLHDVDQETKEDALMAHSERLAFAQGLMNSSARSPIRIIKNLRVCGDCHNALKIASRLVGREIIMRDAKRFHHLKDGLCSCRDYW